MVAKIGSMFYCARELLLLRSDVPLLFCLTLSLTTPALLYATTSLELSIENGQGIRLTSVGLGATFSVVVRVKDDEELHAWPTVEGLSKFQVVGQRSDINMVKNGSASTQERRFLYSALADTAGDFTIGPARADARKSGTATLTVLDKRSTRKEDYPQPTYELILEKKHVVVGEKIPFVLRFTYQDPELTLVALAEPQTSGLRSGPLDEGVAHSAVINNELFQVVEYKGYMYPERAGVFAVPRLRADYTQGVNNHSQIGWGFFRFGSFAQKQAVLSQPQSVRVDDLPTDMPVEAVGTFTDFTATLSAASVAQGEAVLYTLSLEGEGESEKIKTPVLKVPDEIRFYESKSTVASKGPLIIKKWEYVLQGLKEGIYTIKEQRFTYFDTKTRSVKTLKTKPLKLTIEPGSFVSSSQVETVEREAAKPFAEKPQMPLKTPKAKKAVPLPLFILLFMIPPVFVGLRLMIQTFQPTIKKMQCSWRALWALRLASWRIQKVCKSGDLSPLSSIIKKAFLDHYCLDDTEHDLGDIMLKQGWSKHLVKQWEAFLHELLLYTQFVPRAPKTVPAASLQPEAVCKAAQNWLVTFRKGPL